jgi:predicted house-cleaning noncanonical NTP pyrophosphatase (MazG superfamily)
MKHVLLMAVLISALAVSYSFAQMGHGMMREHGSGEGMMEHMMMHQGMMSREQTAESISDLMRQLSELMRDLSGKIEKSQTEKPYDPENIMKDLSDELDVISRIVEKGTATDEEVKDIRERIAKTRGKIFQMDK